MHMADALLSPATGAVMWTATAATTAYAARSVRAENDAARIPLMGVTGAFVFAAQMLNFSIPGTGSSGHLGGGLLLAILLGPEAAFLVMTSVLAVQALFFGDGGLLALGANVLNLGFLPAFVAYPLIYRPLAGDGSRRWRVLAGSVLAGVVALQLGSLGVVLETVVSGIGRLPFGPFLLLMQPIHLAIGLVEGLVTAGVVLFVARVQPELVSPAEGKRSAASRPLRTITAIMASAALITAGVLAGLASQDPDGLEWSVARLAGEHGPESGGRVHTLFGEIQSITAVLPDYGRTDADVDAATATSMAGLVGAGVVALVVFGIGYALSRRRRRRDSE